MSDELIRELREWILRLRVELGVERAAHESERLAKERLIECHEELGCGGACLGCLNKLLDAAESARDAAWAAMIEECAALCRPLHTSPVLCPCQGCTAARLHASRIRALAGTRRTE